MMDQSFASGSMASALRKAAQWLEIEGVEAVAQGEEAGCRCIIVLASRPAEVLRNRIPSSVDGVPVILRAARGPGPDG
jgi:hypothetical protein